jgi:hypothetical protein
VRYSLRWLITCAPHCIHQLQIGVRYQSARSQGRAVEEVPRWRGRDEKLTLGPTSGSALVAAAYRLDPYDVNAAGLHSAIHNNMEKRLLWLLLLFTLLSLLSSSLAACKSFQLVV